MQADVSPNGVITEVRIRNKFTTAKTEFQHLSSERTAESTEDEEADREELGEEKAPDTGECQTDLNSEDSSEEIGSSEVCVKSEKEEPDDTPTTESNHTNGTEHHNDDTELNTAHSMESNSEDCQVSNKLQEDEANSSEDAACVKKPKLESQDFCDNNGGFDPLGKSI